MQGQGQQETITFEQKVNILQNLTLFPALTIIVFLRRKVGFRFLDMLKIQAMFVLLLAYGGFCSLTFGPVAGGVIALFAWMVLIAAIIERRLRWHDIKRGVSWHTYSRGISWFNSFLPLSEVAARRFLDPAVALIVGILFFFLFQPFGFYLILSAVCLFLFETIDYQKQIDLMLDHLDNLVQSEVLSDNIDYFQSGAAGGVRSVEETAGIPTGTDPDLAEAIERKRARSRKNQQTQNAPPAPVPVANASSAQAPVSPQPGGFTPMQNSNSIQASQPHPPQNYPQQEQTPSTPSSTVSRRRIVLPDNLVMPDISQPSPSQQTAPLQAATTQAQDTQQQQGIPFIKSINDPAFAALPSGAPFMTPDGVTRWKK